MRHRENMKERQRGTEKREEREERGRESDIT
jgi:hypothetical protein